MLNKGESVLILIGTSVEEIVYESLAAAVNEVEDILTLLIIATPANFGHELPEIVAAAILKADVVIAACCVSATHTNAVRQGLKSEPFDCARYVQNAHW